MSDRLNEIIKAGGTRATTQKNTVLVTVTTQGELVVGDSNRAWACRWVSEDVAQKLTEE